MYCCIKSASFFQLSQLPFETNIASMVMVWSVIPSSFTPNPSIANAVIIVLHQQKSNNIFDKGENLEGR